MYSFVFEIKRMEKIFFNEIHAFIIITSLIKKKTIANDS